LKSGGEKEMMPVLFVGHGHPINAIQKNPFTSALTHAAADLPKPRAILVVSAHWLTRNRVVVSAAEHPHTIYDFGPFHPDIFKVVYGAPGSPALARHTAKIVHSLQVGISTTRGLDHGAWTILKHLFPAADIPVFQLSIDFAQPSRFHYDLGRELLPLRSEGVLIIGSGNIVHNLMRLDWDHAAAPTENWASSFDKNVADLLTNKNHDALIEYDQLEFAEAAVPTNDHYLPMLYAIALQEKGEKVNFIHEGFQYANLSMRCFRIG
jgi:4,5-DOPA dioxygenase extradiol